MLVVRTQIKEILNEAKLKDANLNVDNISADFQERLDAKVKLMILDACNRAKENGRRTVMARDI